MAKFEAATEAELKIIETQLGRVPRGVLGVAAFCRAGSRGANSNSPANPEPPLMNPDSSNPTPANPDSPLMNPPDSGNPSSPHPCVIATSPRLPGGQPFPTFYYLTCPAAVAACSHLEANGVMREAEALLADPENPEFAAAYRKAHQAYLADRAASVPDGNVPEIADFSAGGMPDRVKCFHALLGHALAAPGVNPVGDWVLARLRAEGLWSPETCDWH